jgi:hypothetical protein
VRRQGTRRSGSTVVASRITRIETLFLHSFALFRRLVRDFEFYCMMYECIQRLRYSFGSYDICYLTHKYPTPIRGGHKNVCFSRRAAAVVTSREGGSRNGLEPVNIVRSSHGSQKLDTRKLGSKASLIQSWRRQDKVSGGDLASEEAGACFVLPLRESVGCTFFCSSECEIHRDRDGWL